MTVSRSPRLEDRPTAELTAVELALMLRRAEARAARRAPGALAPVPVTQAERVALAARPVRASTPPSPSPKSPPPLPPLDATQAAALVADLVAPEPTALAQPPERALAGPALPAVRYPVLVPAPRVASALHEPTWTSLWAAALTVVAAVLSATALVIALRL
jgi:hypothetical protein